MRRAAGRVRGGVCAFAWALAAIAPMVHCAGIVGITDVPPGDGGASPRGDGSVQPGHDGASSGQDARSTFDTSSPGPDGASPGPDGASPGSDGASPGSDGAAPGTDGAGPGGGLTYQPSNTGKTTFDPGPTDNFVIQSGDSCIIYTDFPDPIGPSCSGPSPVADDVFGVTLPDGGGQAVMYVFRSITIEDGASLVVQGKYPLILVSLGSVIVSGTIDASADRYDPGVQAIPGEHENGSGVGEYSATEGPQGGGGGSFCGTGGTGAVGSGTRANDGSLPGATYGTASLVPLTGGSAGGGATTNSTDGLSNGRGGGAIQISAAGVINIKAAGILNVNGSGGSTNGTEASTAGGSGGAILLEAPSVTVAGTLVAAGGQGSDPGSDGETPPDDGGVADGPGIVGGAGSAGDQMNGSNGGTDSQGYGGGGGGAGRIRINATSVTTTGATISPSMGSACATQGGLP